MFIASDFVVVHLSKTGGTFVERTLREMFCSSALGRKIHRLKTRYGVPIPFYPYRYDEQCDQHALCNDIPESQRGKTIMSCIRNPFDLYVSEYTFGWWKKHPGKWFHDLPAFEKLYPDWRSFSFGEFFSISCRHASWVQRTLAEYPKANRLGWFSHKFVYYYCRDYDYVFQAVEDPDLFFNRVKETMYPVHFIHTEQLNRELYAFLLAKGYAEERIASIPTKEKINTSRKDYNWRKWYDEELRRGIEEKDALIFRLFPEFQF